MQSATELLPLHDNAAYCSLVSTVPSALLSRSHCEGQLHVLAFAEEDGEEALAAEEH